MEEFGTCRRVRCCALHGTRFGMIGCSFVSLITLRLLPYDVQVGFDLRLMGRFMQGFA